MNVYDKAHELARALKECSEVMDLRNASKKIEGNSSNKKMLDDFRKIQFEAYSEQIKDGKISEDIMKKLNDLGSIISMNPDISNYLQVEAKFGVMWEDIMKILNDAIDVKMDFGVEK